MYYYSINEKECTTLRTLSNLVNKRKKTKYPFHICMFWGNWQTREIWFDKPPLPFLHVASPLSFSWNNAQHFAISASVLTLNSGVQFYESCRNEIWCVKLLIWISYLLISCNRKFVSLPSAWVRLFNFCALQRVHSCVQIIWWRISWGILSMRSRFHICCIEMLPKK